MILPTWQSIEAAACIDIHRVDFQYTLIKNRRIIELLLFRTDMSKYEYYLFVLGIVGQQIDIDLQGRLDVTVDNILKIGQIFSKNRISRFNVRRSPVMGKGFIRIFPMLIKEIFSFQLPVCHLGPDPTGNVCFVVKINRILVRKRYRDIDLTI